MTESVRQYGVLVSGIARMRPQGGYEIIAGHTRKAACELAGLDTMPMFIRNLNDYEATIVMGTVTFREKISSQAKRQGHTVCISLHLIQVMRKRRAEFTIPFEKPKAVTFLQSVGISVYGIPIALMVSVFASLLSSAGANRSEGIAKYPVWIAIIAFAIVPAVVEKYVFCGLILEAYMKVDTRAAVMISGLFFALLHFPLGLILYEFF